MDHKPLQDALAQALFQRCGISVIHEPRTSGSTPSDCLDLCASCLDKVLDIITLSAFTARSVSDSAKHGCASILKRKGDKRRSYDRCLTAFGPGIKLLFSRINHARVIGDDAKQVLRDLPSLWLGKGCGRSPRQPASSVLTGCPRYKVASLQGFLRYKGHSHTGTEMLIILQTTHLCAEKPNIRTRSCLG